MPHTGPAPSPSPAAFDFGGSSPAGGAGDDHTPFRRTRSGPNAPAGNNSLTYILCGVGFLLLAGIPLVIHLPRLSGEASKGARPVTAADLKAIEDVSRLPERDRWVKFNAERITKHGLVEETNRRGAEKETAEYVTAEVGDRLMVVKVPVGFQGSLLEGRLDAVGTEADEQAREKLRQKFPEQKGKWLPFLMSANQGSASTGPIAIIAICAAGVLIGLGSLVYGLSLSGSAAKRGRRR